MDNQIVSVDLSLEDLAYSEDRLTPSEYFNVVKERKQTITDEQLSLVYDNCLELLEKYKITGQTEAIRKLLFHLSCIEKEREIVKEGINTFVYRDDIEYYISHVTKDTVKIIEMERYLREIPDDIVDIIAKVKDKFDQLYIVFTDYTGSEERRVQKERREKDPILFGTFQDKNSRTVIDRFYYLGDWVDEYCDLTLDKMVNETKNLGHRNIQHTIKTPEDIQELKNQLSSVTYNTGNNQFIVTPNKNSTNTNNNVFSKIKTFLNRK